MCILRPTAAADLKRQVLLKSSWVPSKIHKTYMSKRFCLTKKANIASHYKSQKYKHIDNRVNRNSGPHSPGFLPETSLARETHLDPSKTPIK